MGTCSSTSSISRTSSATRHAPGRRRHPACGVLHYWWLRARPSWSAPAWLARHVAPRQAILGLAFIGMFFLWGEDTPTEFVAIPLCLMGLGVGLAGTPSSNSLTESVPVRRVGRASGTADLQRDLGGALMTSIFGALLDGGLRGGHGDRHLRVRRRRDRQHAEPAPALVRQRRGPGRSSIPSMATKIISAAQSWFWTVTSWHMPPAWAPCSSASG